MTDRELMRMALDALEKLNKDGWILADFEDEVYASIEALRARLAQPEPEPVAWMHDSHVGFNVPLYTASPQREWQGLTDEAVWNLYKNLWMFHPAEEPRLAGDILKFARAIEDKLKEKNA